MPRLDAASWNIAIGRLQAVRYSDEIIQPDLLPAMSFRKFFNMVMPDRIPQELLLTV